MDISHFEIRTAGQEIPISWYKCRYCGYTTTLLLNVEKHTCIGKESKESKVSDSKPMVQYRHPGDPKSIFVQYTSGPLPIWAIDVREFQEPKMEFTPDSAYNLLYKVINDRFQITEPDVRDMCIQALIVLWNAQSDVPRGPDGKDIVHGAGGMLQDLYDIIEHDLGHAATHTEACDLLKKWRNFYHERGDLKYLPEDCSSEMLQAAWNESKAVGFDIETWQIDRLYEAMWKAAPEVRRD